MPPIPQGDRELATFLDVNQFQPGKTGYACGYYACRLVAAATPLGRPPRYSAAEIIAQAEADYARFDGSNDASNRDGMSLAQLYADLKELHLAYRILPTTYSAVLLSLRAGWPVLVSVAETSVIDVALGRCPYDAWTPSGNHIFTVTGLGPGAEGQVWVRDTANVAQNYELRPGPRLYDCRTWQIVSATEVHLPWQIAPARPVAPPPLAPTPDDREVWGLCKPDVPLVAEHAIPQSWLQARWRRGWNFGPPLESERSVSRGGETYIEQQFTAARASYSPRSGVCVWWTAEGPKEV